MSNEIIVKRLNRFIQEVQERYPNLNIDINYVEDDDFYEVRHDDNDLDFDPEFDDLTERKSEEIEKEGIDNFVFYYSPIYEDIIKEKNGFQIFIKDSTVKSKGLNIDTKLKGTSNQNKNTIKINALKKAVPNKKEIVFNISNNVYYNHERGVA